MAYNTNWMPPSLIDNHNVTKIYILATISCIFIYLNSTVDQRDFSDTDTYLYYIDNIYFFRESDWWTFETLSKALMISLRALARDTELSIFIYRYILIIFFPFFIYYVYRRSSWQAMLVALALYGPLLGLITMRATPAYILAALAAVSAIDGRWRSIAYLLGGFLFHVSTALAIPASIAVLAMKKYGFKNIKTRYIIMSFILLGIVSLFVAGFGVQYFLNFVGSFSYLAKYTTYVPDADEAASMAAEGPKIVHYIFAVAVVGLSIFLIYRAKEDQGAEKMFVAFSLVIYLALFSLFSPVVSLRYSPFYILPALSRIDISFRGSLGGLAGAAVVAGSAAVFALSLQQVIYDQ